ADVLPRVRRNGGAATALLADTDCWTQPANGSTDVRVTTVTLLDLRAADLAPKSRCFVGGTQALYMTPEHLYLATTRWPVWSATLQAYPDAIRTDIHKFAFAATGVSYRASGSVPGHLGWNPADSAYRFSEWNGDLRVLSFTGNVGWATTADSVPPRGVRVILRNNANLSTGGTATDVTDDVHPEFAAQAVAAAQTIGLDIAGVDVVCDSVLRPLEEQGGGIVEVNAAPGLRMHLQPSFGKGRPVGQAIIDHMFAAGETGRIPVVAVAGTNGKTTTVRLIANILSEMGHRVGMTSTDGVYITGRRIDTGDCSGPKSARNVLLHPEVDAAVLETARGGVLREGLGFDRCDVAVVTNIGLGDHLGLSYISTVEDLSVVKRVIVNNVTPKTGVAVLNAADPLVAKMAETCPGRVIFFASDRNQPIMATQRAQRRPVVYRDGATLVAAGDGVERRVPVAEIPITRHGAVGFQIENAMAAIAAAWALGIDWPTICRGLASFVNDAQNAPGRFNVFDYRGATLIADYGHNPDAIQALVEAIDQLPQAGGRRSVVISGAGDRRDEDIRQQTRILGAAFDHVILYQDQCQRGRADGEVLALLQEGLHQATRTRQVQEIHGEFLAIDTALDELRPGDLCLILIDQIEDALAYIAKRLTENP
ncbi:MAG TPA: Mur ligase family protein, partial [Accumulibacter sp.]|nr:Mur ligase family protein [Accumulibacter sp.]